MQIAADTSAYTGTIFFNSGPNGPDSAVVDGSGSPGMIPVHGSVEGALALQDGQVSAYNYQILGYTFDPQTVAAVNEVGYEPFYLSETIPELNNIVVTDTSFGTVAGTWSEIPDQFTTPLPAASHSSPAALARWVCSAGAGSARL